jgi:hypothetical protein
VHAEVGRQTSSCEWLVIVRRHGTPQRARGALSGPPNDTEFCGEGPPEFSAKLDRGAAVRLQSYHGPCGPAYRANSEIGRRSFVRSNSTLGGVKQVTWVACFPTHALPPYLLHRE